MSGTSSDTVRQILGDGGRWQLRSILLIYLMKIPAAWFMACVIFTAPNPLFGEYYCLPLGSNVTLERKEVKTWISVVNPVVTDYYKESVDLCQIYVNAEERYEKVMAGESVEGLDETTMKCDNFLFQTEYETKVSAFELVCGRNILISVTQSFHLLGVFLGAVVAINLLKSYDPKTVMVLGMILQVMFGVLSGEVKLAFHTVLRTLDSANTALMYVSGSMIFVDITDKGWRLAAMCMFESFWGIGVILLGAIGFFFKEWNHIYYAISLPTLLLIWLSRWIPNSPQWLLKKGRIQEVKMILEDAARVNQTTHMIPKDLDGDLREQMKVLQSEPQPSKWREIWQQDKRTSINLVCVHLLQTSAISLNFATLLYIENFGRDFLYVNCIVAGSFEIFGTLIGYFLVKQSPRHKWQWLALMNLFGGISILVNWFIIFDDQVPNQKILMILMCMGTKIAASCSLAVMSGCTAELVTGNRKKTATYSVLVFSRVVFLAAPYIGGSWYYLGRMGPISLMGGLSLLNAILSFIISPKLNEKSISIDNKQPISPEAAKLLFS